MRAFIQSRLSTHGRQGGFAVDIDDVLDEDNDNLIFSSPSRMRGISMPSNAGQNSLPLPRMPRQSSAYTTPSQRTVMRECSQPVSN